MYSEVATDCVLRVEEVSGATVDALMNIKVAPEQEKLVAPNAEWIAEAAYVPDCKTYGVFQDNEAVGMFSLVDPRLHPENYDEYQPGCAFLWRIMVCGKHQHKGYGEKLIDLAFELAVEEGHRGLSLGIMEETMGNAKPFYERCGFKASGRQLNGETEMVKYAELVEV